MISTHEAHLDPNPDAGAASRRPRPGARLGRRNRRGSIYAVVLGMAILVSLIGLSAVAVGRVNLRVASVGSDGSDAELLALSAVEHATSTINTDANWRTNYVSGTKIPQVRLGRGSFTWKLVDEADDSLATGGLQPVRVWGIGTAGEASRCYSVVLAPGGTNLATNPGMESGVANYEVQGTDCTLEPWADEPHNGAKYVWVKTRFDRTAGPQQNLTGKVTSGTSYYVELWVKMITGPEEPWFSFVIKKVGVSDTVYKVRGQMAKSTEWTRVYGTLTPSWSGTPDSVYWRIETNTSGQEFKIDDLKIVQAGGSTPMAPASETWRQEPLP
jgi:hypothetical protein